eukprot:CAMPEP_0197578560 /NCGR_PEP_ID=MMETSP1326-20131121/2714_1 /TAXON_ID=1155430 /ORGANISM="Genus nov. species nov., Strain RCC2288" /LENGTH=395 /DNA_ID=CAMNT_0043141747 /DNA_START=306 /DNA_END=1489 /DNA_ORIENTATION=-
MAKHDERAGVVRLAQFVLSKLSPGLATLGGFTAARAMCKAAKASFVEKGKETPEPAELDKTLDHTLDMLERMAAGTHVDADEVTKMRSRLLSDVDKARRDSTNGDEDGENPDDDEDPDDEDPAAPGGGGGKRGGGGNTDAFAYDSHTAAWLMDMVRPEKDSRSSKTDSPATPAPTPRRPTRKSVLKWQSGLKLVAGASQSALEGLENLALAPSVPELQAPFCPSFAQMTVPREVQMARQARYSNCSSVNGSEFGGGGGAPPLPDHIPDPSMATQEKLEEATLSWTFDAFAYAARLEYPLATLTWHLLHHSHLIHELKLDKDALEKFLLAVDAAYAAPFCNPAIKVPGWVDDDPCTDDEAADDTAAVGVEYAGSRRNSTGGSSTQSRRSTATRPRG